MTDRCIDCEALLEELVLNLQMFPTEPPLGVLQYVLENRVAQKFNRENVQKLAHECYVNLEGKVKHKKLSNVWLEYVKENFQDVVRFFEDKLLNLECENEKIMVSSTKNRRRYLEDAYLVITHLEYFCAENDLNLDSNLTELLNASVYVVLDGHGGRDVAQFSQKYFGPYVAKEILGMFDSKITFEDQTKLIINGFNEYMRVNYPQMKSGSTITMCIIYKERIFSAWRGDSYAYLIGKEGNTISLVTTLHSLNEEVERSIVLRGCNAVLLPGKDGFLYNGMTSVSRSLGNFSFTTYQCTDSFSFEIKGFSGVIIIASDGLWNVLTIEQLSKLCLKCSNCCPRQIHDVIKEELKSAFLQDNVTFIVAPLNND